MDPSNAEDCHQTKSSKDPKKVIVKLSRRKDANKILVSKKRSEGYELIITHY